MQISSQPYLKTYTFPFFSVGTLMKVILLVLSVGLPFFITYSTPNFYMTSHLTTNTTQTITYNYKYHIELTTSASSYIYTNLYQYYSSRAISIEQFEEGSVVNFKAKWSKSNMNERVMRAEVTLFFNYLVNGISQLGIASGIITGYNIAEGSIAGFSTIERGTGQGTISQSNLTLNAFNLLTTQLQMTQSQNFLNYEYSSLPINLPTDMVSLTMTVNYGSVLVSNDTPSILGQVVWSWVQYFPIFLTIYWLLDRSFCFLLRQKIVRCEVMHDKEYLGIIQDEKSRREKLRQL